MELVVHSERDLFSQLCELDPYCETNGELFHDLIESSFGGPKTAYIAPEPITSIIFKYRPDKARSALEDARRYYIKLDASRINSGIGSIVNFINSNAFGMIGSKISGFVNRGSIDQEFNFDRSTFRWAVARLYEFGWREESNSGDELVLVLSAQPRGEQRLGRA